MGDDSPSELPTVLVLRRSPTIALLEPIFSQKFNFLKAWDSPLPQDQFLTTHAGSIQALIASVHGPPITAQILQSLPSLKFITTTSAGLDHVDLAECQRRGVAVANASKAFAEDAADMAVGLFIDVMRKISASNRYVRDGLWATRGDYPLGSKIPITQEAEMTGLQFCDAKDDVPSEQLPHLLLIHPPSSFTRFPPEFCAKFPVLKAWESPLPLDQFLSTHAGSIQALLVRGYLMVNADILEQLPALKLVLTISVGVNHIDMAECRRRGISVANVGSAYSEDVADIAVGLYIDVLRKLSAADRYVRQGFWSSKGNYPLGSKVITSTSMLSGLLNVS